MSFLTQKQRRQLELCGIEPKKQQLPAPIWMQSLSSGIVKTVALFAFVILAVNVAEWAVQRDQQMQRQQKIDLQRLK